MAAPELVMGDMAGRVQEGPGRCRLVGPVQQGGGCGVGRAGTGGRPAAPPAPAPPEGSGIAGRLVRPVDPLGFGSPGLAD